MDAIRMTLTRMGELTATPSAFAIVLVYAGLWWLVQPESLDWHGTATLATWFMTLFIQRAEHRDTQAIQGKLDELIRADRGARTEITRLDQHQPEEIEKRRSAEQEEN